MRIILSLTSIFICVFLTASQLQAVNGSVSVRALSFPGELTAGGDDISSTHRITGFARAFTDYGDFRIGGGFGYEWNDYNDNRLFFPGGANPTVTTLMGEFGYRFNEKLRVMAIATADWAGDSGAERTDSRMLLGFLGPILRANETTEIGVMLGQQERLAGSNRLIVFPFINWQISERLSLRGRRGPIFSYNLFPTDAVQIVVGAEFEWRQFLLTETIQLDEPAVLQDEGVVAFGGVRLNFKRGFFLEVTGVFIPERRWEVYDFASGDLIRTDKIRNSPGLRIEGGWRF